MAFKAPKLKKIDDELLLFGKIHLEWSNVGATTYFLYKDYEPIKDISGWQPYQIIEDGKTYFDDSFFENNRTYYYSVCAFSKETNGKSALSNTEKIIIKLPPNLVVDRHQVEEAAYYESCDECNEDKKIWQLAQLRLIFEKTFPMRDLEYLKIGVKVLSRDLPEFNGLFIEPTESEIRKIAVDIFNKHKSRMDIDWELSELKLIRKKLEELIEYQAEIR